MREREECEHCKGWGEIACFTRNGHYKCAGPVPEDARGVFPSKCDECNGTGYVNDGLSEDDDDA